MLYICDCDRTALENLALTFAGDSKPALLYESLAERNACVELKKGGTEISATEENKAEYIQLLVEHRVVEPQITAFRNGLGGLLTAACRGPSSPCLHG